MTIDYLTNIFGDFFTFLFQVIRLKTQLSYYKKVECWLREKLGNDEAKLIVSRAVYLFSIGTNDYASPFFTNNFTLLNSSSHSEYVGIVIGNLTTAIKVSIVILIKFLLILFHRSRVINLMKNQNGYLSFIPFAGNLWEWGQKICIYQFANVGLSSCFENNQNRRRW